MARRFAVLFGIMSAVAGSAVCFLTVSAPASVTRETVAPFLIIGGASMVVSGLAVVALSVAGD